MTSLQKVLILLVAIFFWPTTSLAVITCKTPDKSFKNFLVHFTEDVTFQQSRIILPLVYRFGDYTMTEPIIELWGKDKIKTLSDLLILSRSQRKAEGIEQYFLLVTARYAEIFQDRPEADDYRMLYKFRNVYGCWFLEEVHDKAL